jgi:Tol biopolymer transport system component
MVEDNKGKHIAKSTKISSYKRITSGESWHLYPDISPDSKSITYVRGGDQKSLQIVIESNQKNKVLGTRGFILQPKFSKSANLLFASKKIDGKNKIIKIDVKEMSETINAQDINGELVYPDSYQIIENENSYFPIPFQNGEKIIYQRNTDTKRIVLKNLIDNKELIIGEGMSPSLSKDEMFVAYTKKMNNNWDIHIYNLLTKKTIKVTSDKHFDFSPAFSPNGDLYYTSDRAENGVFSIFMQTKSSWQDREKFEILYLAERGTSFYAPRFSGKESYKLSSLKSMPGKARSSFGAIEHNKYILLVAIKVQNTHIHQNHLQEELLCLTLRPSIGRT